ALGVEAGGYGDRLDQRRLAAAVLARQQRHVGVEVEVSQLPDRGNRERIHGEVVDLAPLQEDRADKGAVTGLHQASHGSRMRGSSSSEAITASSRSGFCADQGRR